MCTLSFAVVRNLRLVNTAATLIYETTGDLQVARMCLGHADEKTTELYAHAT